MRFRFHTLGLFVLCASAVGSNVHAQTAWPNKPIRLILQSAPGGTSDLVARMLQVPLQEAFGQPVVVESRPGSFGIIAGQAVAKSSPDGYTLGLFGSSLATNVVTQKNLPYDALKDFTAVALVAKAPSIIAVNVSSPYNSIQELVAAARAKPGSLSFGSSGVGLAPHFAVEWLKHIAGVNMVHVPYKGAGPAMTGAIGGEIPIVVTVAGSVTAHIQGGRLRALAVSGAERLPLLPNVPTVAEQGYPGFSIIDWFGVVGPAGMPADVTQRLNAEINKALRVPVIAERLRSLGFQLGSQSPEEFRTFIESEVKTLGTIIREAKISTE
jgi:tripartite-type tricarboxylate transporter receptor subunit TctC